MTYWPRKWLTCCVPHDKGFHEVWIRYVHLPSYSIVAAEGKGRGKEVSPPHWEWGLGRGHSSSPENGWIFAIKMVGFVHSGWNYLPFKCPFYTQKWCFWPSETNTFDENITQLTYLFNRNITKFDDHCDYVLNTNNQKFHHVSSLVVLVGHIRSRVRKLMCGSGIRSVRAMIWKRKKNCHENANVFSPKAQM